MIKNFDFTKLMVPLAQLDVPSDSITYHPTVDSLESLNLYHEIKDRLFGEQPIQIGYCAGYNHKMNALEYHRCSEINIAVTDAILLLGRQQDINPIEFTYDSALVEAFLLPSSYAVELYATTLHYAPISVGENPFNVAVILPRGTNTPLKSSARMSGEDSLLVANNKWLLAHADICQSGQRPHIIGDNIIIK